MEYRKLDELLERAEALPRQRNMVIAHANEMHSIEMAVDMVRDGKADLLVKGMLETSQMLRPVVKKDTGIGTGRVMSHLSVNEIPSYHKLITITDGGMFTYSSLNSPACF